MATYPRLREQAERVDGAASYVAKASNLTDLTDAAAARSALGLGSAATMTPTTLAANSAFTSTYAKPGGALRRWRQKLANDPANAKVVLCGDSTSDATTAAGITQSRLMALHTQQGEALYGLASSDYFTDGVANGTTTFTSATAAFTSADVGRLVWGKGFPLSTTITAVGSATSVTLGASVPSGTSLPFWVGRHVINGGNNGVPLDGWFANPSSGSYPFNRDKLVTANPDLIVYSWLFNDIRQGGLGTTVDACVSAGITRLQSLIDWTIATLPNADILLRMPNTMLTANVSSLNFVTDGVTTNPAGQAQIYSTALRRIYLHFVGLYPNVDVIDIQAEVFGTRCVASHPYMADQLHPSTNTIADINGLVRSGGGYAAIADAIARRIGFERNAFPPSGAQRVRHEFLVYDAPSANQVRLISRDPYGLPAPQAPVFNGDSLYINGVDSPITLGSTAVDRTVSSTVLLLTGLTGDFSPYIGQTAVVAGTHAPQATGDRQQIFVDLPNIVAGTTVTQSVSVSGVFPGSVGKGTGVTVAPGATFATSGLLLLGCYPSGTGTVKCVIQNPTAGDIDLAGESWTFWVLR